MFNNKNVLVAGCNGYIGNALIQRLLIDGYHVTGIDSDIKYKWANSLKSVSIIEQLGFNERLKRLKKLGSFLFSKIDIVNDIEELSELLSNFQFDTIINLAQQPSAAYSQISLNTAIETLNNNTNGTLNMLWLLSDVSPHTHYIEIESMGTMQPDIGIDIPEGYFYPESEPEYDEYDTEEGLVKRTIGKKSIFPRRPGSIYHASKTANTYLVDCANRWWNLKITAINQGVVYGNGTKEIQETGIHSPLWVDECFGTVINRFIAQALLDIPLTIYGGQQKRGFIGLNDSVQAITLLIENPPTDSGVRFVNQLDRVLSINEIANLISNNQQIIPSPRIESTESFYYNPITNILKDLGFRKTTNILTEIEFALQHIDKKLLKKMKPLLLQPKIEWKRDLHSI